MICQDTQLLYQLSTVASVFQCPFLSCSFVKLSALKKKPGHLGSWYDQKRKIYFAWLYQCIKHVIMSLLEYH